MGYYVDSIDGLRQHRGQASEQIFLRGYSKSGDGGDGFFVWDTMSGEKDDGGTIIDPSDGSRLGRWIRMTRGRDVTPLWWGAKFDDTADDTAAIQAAVDYAIGTGGNVLLPSGTAKITRTLVLASKGRKPHSGFHFSGRGKFGDSGSSMRAGSGTLIKYYGPADSAEAIVNLDGSLWRYTTVGNLSLMCQTLNGCKHGILFSSTEFSQDVIENITVSNSRIAFAIHGANSGNGEFTYFSNCAAANVEGFFYNNSGQSYNQRFDHCSCGLMPGGTYFHLDIVSGISPGGGLIVTDFNATGGNAGDPNPPTNSTLLKSAQNIPPVMFIGGRIEHLTRLIELGSDFVGLDITIQGMDLTVDCDPTLPKNSVGAFITVRNNPSTISIRDCAISGVRRAEVLSIDLTQCVDYGPLIRFTGCLIGGFVASPRIDGLRHDAMSSVRFTDCRLATMFRHPIRGGQPGDGRLQPLNMSWGSIHADEAVRARALSSASALAVSGKPSNLLVSPAISALANGEAAAAMPDAAWSAIGAPGGLSVAREDRAEEKLRTASRWGRILTFKAGCGVFQDIAQIDLATTDATTHYFYLPVHELYYQALIRWVFGKGSLRIALENSVTGETYDEAILKSTQPMTSGPHLVSLLGRVPPLAEPSLFRLKLHNLGPDPVNAAMAWQFASQGLDASFVGMEGVSELAADWSLSAESVRAWDRFMLPLKPDRYGSSAPHPPRDLYSDQYMSADDGRLTYFAGDRWCKAPRTAYGDGPPQQGIWRVSDQLLNRAPKAGSYVGWICVTAGAPGEWRPFGLIA
jgi:hypothetical protein